MKRRELIAGIGSAAASRALWPVSTRAQQAAIPVIGYLSSGRPSASAEGEFLGGLVDNGFVESRNVAIEYRWAEGQYERLPSLAAELVSRHVSVIFATPTQAALAAKDATATIPIIFTTGFDPVRLGLVASFNRPSGNITGVAYLSGQLGAKKLDLLRQVVPNATLIAVLVNPTNPVNRTAELTELRAAAETIGRKLLVIRASTEDELNSAFASLVQQQVGAVIVTADQFFVDQSVRIAALAADRAVPMIYENRGYVQVGGLMSYGADLLEQYHLAGIYVGRVLKGERPADLPVVQPTKFEFVINLRTAHQLNLEIPAKLLALADEVIE
jgi:putative ABC transport system substrate-binding protein